MHSSRRHVGIQTVPTRATGSCMLLVMSIQAVQSNRKEIHGLECRFKRLWAQKHMIWQALNFHAEPCQELRMTISPDISESALQPLCGLQAVTHGPPGAGLANDAASYIKQHRQWELGGAQNHTEQAQGTLQARSPSATGMFAAAPELSRCGNHPCIAPAMKDC